MSNTAFEIAIDLYGDWIGMLRTELISNGYPIDTDDDPFQVCIKYFNVQKRQVPPRPRSVEVSREFTNPPEHLAAIELIKNKATNGEDLTPHLSTSLLRPDFHDALLNDWGIYHFHLGVSAHERIPNFVERTGSLLFARVTEDKFYMIDVMQHGDWSQKRLLEILHANWPTSIGDFRLEVDGLSQELTEDEIEDSRKSGISFFVRLADGTIYAPPGGGYSSTGVSVGVVKNCNFCKKLLKDSEKYLKENMQHYVEQVRLQGKNIGSQCKFKLAELSRDGAEIIETNSNFKLTIPFEHKS